MAALSQGVSLTLFNNQADKRVGPVWSGICKDISFEQVSISSRDVICD